MIFKSRVPDLPEDAFIVYLAIGLWPWMAFSESILDSITAVVSRKDLLGKVKIDLRNVVIAGTTANFILHGLGFVSIIFLLIVMGKLSVSLSLLLLVFPLLILYILAIGFSLLFSALYVFYRDVKQIVSAFLPLLFFCTPIIYAWSNIPDKLKGYFSINPLLPVINFIHDLVFNINPVNWLSLAKIFVFGLIMLFLTNLFFKKLAPRFDDFV